MFFFGIYRPLQIFSKVNVSLFQSWPENNHFKILMEIGVYSTENNFALVIMSRFVKKYSDIAFLLKKNDVILHHFKELLLKISETQ